MNELTSYLASLESRIQALESQNSALQKYIGDLGGDAQKMLPKTSLLSPNFLQRAFTVWGHYFVAQLIIGVPLFCIYMIITYLAIKQGLAGLPTP
jgi:hypothetical protein